MNIERSFIKFFSEVSTFTSPPSMSMAGSSIIGFGANVVRSLELLILLAPTGLSKFKLSDVSS